MSGYNYAKINFELDDQVEMWTDMRTSWSYHNTTYEASSSRNGNNGKDVYCYIDLSHTHSVSGSTGEMSGYDYATISLELDDQVDTWNDVRTSWSSPDRTTYEASSNRNGNGKNAYCDIDLSHTHSVSGSTGEMSGYDYAKINLELDD